MRTLLAAVGTVVLLAGCGTATDDPKVDPTVEGSWTSVNVPAISGADSAPVLTTDGDDVLLVTLSDDGVLQGHVASGGPGFKAGPPLETGKQYLGLAGAARLDDGWFALGSGGLVRADGDEQLTFEVAGFRSDDGLTWEEVPLEGFTGPADVNAVAEVDGALVAAGSYRDADDPSMGGFRAVAWRSDDGVSWTEVPLPGAVEGGESYVAGLAVSGDRLLAVGSTDRHGVLWTSDDAGASWQESGQDGLDDSYALSEIAVQGDTVVVSTTPDDGASPGIYRSTDGGDTWSRASGQPRASDIEGYAPLWAGGGRFYTVTSTFVDSWSEPEVCYADIELCRQDSAVVLYASDDGDRWERVDTSGIGPGEDGEVDQVTGTADGRVVAMQVRGDFVRFGFWPDGAPLPVVDAPGAPPTVDLVEVPGNGELEPGVRYHAPLFVHCGMDWLYLGDRAWRRSDDGPDLETGAGDPADPTWPVAGQTIFGYATLGDDGVVDYSIGDGEVIATYEQTKQQPPGCR